MAIIIRWRVKMFAFPATNQSLNQIFMEMKLDQNSNIRKSELGKLVYEH